MWNEVLNFMNYEVGSMWRKWDLHVHTPESILNNQFGSDWDVYFYSLVTKAIKDNIYVYSPECRHICV